MIWRALLLVLVVGISTNRATAEDWNPKNTWVFAVGVIQFDDPSITTYAEKGRADAPMTAAFQQRGVPADHIVFIKDNEATKANIMKRFNSTLAQTTSDDTLIFYYAGHGFRDYKNAARPVSLITYDTASDWRIREVLDAIDKNFHGLRAILLADCCYSGAMAEEAQNRHSNIAFAALTSAQPTSTSTGSWTFTLSITQMLQGNRLLDLNHDGKITMSEAANYINDEMAFSEGQLSNFKIFGGFPADLVMAQAEGPALPKGAGTRCEALYKGEWLKVTILKTEGDRSFVTWVGWDHSQDSWVDAADLRPWQLKTWPIGAPVKIEWEGKWYPGKVLRNLLGLQLVHYNGYKDIDNEWVTPDRLKSL